MLTDEKKRKIYDKYGEEGLKAGIDPDQAADNFGGFGGMPSGGSRTYYYAPSDPRELFEKIFGSRDPFGSFNRGSTGGSGFNGFGSTFGSANFGGFDSDEDPMDYNFSSARTGSGSGFGSAFNRGPARPPPMKYTVPCSLEELYNGCVKHMKVKKHLVDPSGKSVPVDKTFEVHVKPGIKPGTKYTFAEEGDEAPHAPARDVVFVIEEAPHQYFRREGNNLLYTAEINLSQALGGCQLNIPTLDGRRIQVPVREVVTPQYSKVVPREGFPSSKNPSERGDLIINFHVAYPVHLNDSQRQQVKQALYGVTYRN